MQLKRNTAPKPPSTDIKSLVVSREFVNGVCTVIGIGFLFLTVLYGIQ